MSNSFAPQRLVSVSNSIRAHNLPQSGLSIIHSRLRLLPQARAAVFSISTKSMRRYSSKFRSVHPTTTPNNSVARRYRTRERIIDIVRYSRSRNAMIRTRSRVFATGKKINRRRYITPYKDWPYGKRVFLWGWLSGVIAFDIIPALLDGSEITYTVLAFKLSMTALILGAFFCP
jgi:hypothetical protein